MEVLRWIGGIVLVLLAALGGLALIGIVWEAIATYRGGATTTSTSASTWTSSTPTMSARSPHSSTWSTSGGT